jgi:carboxyl-terminal processing protease
MKASMNLRRLAPLALAILPIATYAAGNNAPASPPQDIASLIDSPLKQSTNAEDTDAKIALLTAEAVQQFQFSHHPFDAEISGKFLDRYLEALDYYHVYFLQSDLKEFETYRTNLQVYTLEKHDISPAYVIFKRFLQRATEREAYETNLLQSEHFQFTDHDRFTPDRHEIPNPKDMTDATNLWRQEVRFDYLNEKLAQKLKYVGSVTVESLGHLTIPLVRTTTNATSLEFLPKTLQDQQGHRFGSLDLAGNAATNATLHLDISAGNDLLKVTNHFYAPGGAELGSVRFARQTDTTNGADAKNGIASKEFESIIELKTNDFAKIVSNLTNRYARILKNENRLTNDSHVLETYLTALARAYDPHSDYFGRGEADNFKIRMGLSLVGIGARLFQTDADRCQIQELIAGGPAQLDGQLQTNDIIVSVAQKDQQPINVDGMPLEDVVEKIRGKEGTPVTLTIERESSPGLKTITLIRNRVKIGDDESKAMLFDDTPKIGVVDIPSFYADTDSDDSSPAHERKTMTGDVAALVNRLKKEKVDGIILDLRTNGGGYLNEAIALTGLFAGKGPVVMTKSPDGNIETEGSKNSKPFYDGPLMVLTSRLSASASEILAGALQDYGRAIVVGDKTTFGKGTVQTVQPLLSVFRRPRADDPNWGSLHLTIKKFYRASGMTTESNGVAADIVLPSILNYANLSESSQPNWLPADTVGSADPPDLNEVKPYLPDLLKLSVARREKSQDFAYIQEDIDEYRKRLADKSVSLNESDRRKEQRDDEARDAARKKERAARPKSDEKFYQLTIKNLEQPLILYKSPAIPAPKEISEPVEEDAEAQDPVRNDVILAEARRIMADYIALEKKSLSAATTEPGNKNTMTR